MRVTGTLRPAVSAALALAVVAACGPAPTAPGTGGTPRPPRTAGSGAPDDPSAAPSGSASAPPASLAPGASPPPSVAPSAAASAAIAPSAAPTPTPDPRRALIETKLLALAKVTFGQNRGMLAANKVFDAPGGAALLGNNGAGIISNNGSGILANNGGSLITDNGAGLVANNGAGYRLAQATASPPAFTFSIATTAQAGETLVSSRIWPDDVTLLRFERPAASGSEKVRRLVHMRAGAPFYEETREVTARFADGDEKTSRTTTLDLIAGGRFAVKLVQVGEGDGEGATTRIALGPGSAVRDEVTGGLTRIEALDYDLKARTAAFHYVYDSLGLEERGTLTGVKTNLGGGVTVAFWDPLAVDDGESRVTDAAGALIYTKKQRTVDAKVHRDFDLGDGITLALTRTDDDHYAGRLSEAGRATAGVALEARTDGSSVFVVTFDDDPARPLTVGYGLGGGAPAARPTSPPQWVVLTSAGDVVAGHANGTGEQARFDAPKGFVGSRLSSARLYIADSKNHRVRLLKKSPLAIAAFAGDGTAGFEDGPAAEARFNEPYGLAVAADDTLYVADHKNHAIRVIAPNGVVSTLAGDGTPGFVDGDRAAARFNLPTGLALDGQGGLYVADALNQSIRRVETQGAGAGTVTTIAGGGPGTGGFADGAGAAARFAIPMGLAVGPDGMLYVADRDNNRIRKVGLADPAHPVTTVAGTDDVARLFMDGPALQARFNPPRFLAFGPDGLLYFGAGVDVYYLTAAGELRSYAGVAAPGHRDGASKFAAFQDVQGLAFAPNGVLHVMDGHTLRSIVPPSALEK